MATAAPAQALELFQLAFLDALACRVSPSGYVLSGPANLRHFFDSPRSCEDIHVDAAAVAPHRLASAIDDVLALDSLGALLRVGGAALSDVSKPRSGGASHRWRVAIEAVGLPDPAAVEIQLGGRVADDRYRLNATSDRMAAPYALRPPCIQHSTAGAALGQAISALAGPPRAQARAIFDLDLLLRLGAMRGDRLDRPAPGEAANRVASPPFAAFRDGVLPLLDTDVVELYDTEASWRQMQAFVVERLKEPR